MPESAGTDRPPSGDDRVAHPLLRTAAATVLVGVASGLVGAVCVLVLHAVQHLVFGADAGSFLADVEQSSPARRVLGMTAVGALAGTGWWLHRRYVDREDVSVTRALRDPTGRLPFRATTVDALLQVLVVGAGASLGREGAPRQVGAAAATRIGSWLRLDPRRRRTLLACGAGAGLAAVYDVPLGGAVFTLEILLASGALRDVVPAVVTSGVATVVAWPVVTTAPTYHVPTAHLGLPVLLASVALGPVVGLLGLGFDRLMTWARTHAAHGWHAVPATVLVLAGLGVLATPLPELLGNGKAPAQLAFAGTLGLGVVLALLLLKPAATAASLGAGMIGGLLTPALATGALLGAAVAGVWNRVAPHAPATELALVGAAAFLAVTQRAPLTGIVLTLDLVRTGTALLPALVVAVALGVGTAWLVDPSMRPVALTLRTPGRRGRPGGQAPGSSSS